MTCSRARGNPPCCVNHPPERGRVTSQGAQDVPDRRLTTVRRIRILAEALFADGAVSVFRGAAPVDARDGGVGSRAWRVAMLELVALGVTLGLMGFVGVVIYWFLRLIE